MTADLRFRRGIGAFFSALENPFPGNGDRSRRRLGSNGELLARKPEHLVLARPFGRQIGEADNSHAMRRSGVLSPVLHPAIFIVDVDDLSRVFLA
jgi:hypothetical protein